MTAPGGADGALPIRQDARIYLARPNGTPLTLPLAAGRHAWVQVLRGAADVNGAALATGDGAALSEEAEVTVTGTEPDTEVLVFDLA